MGCNCPQLRASKVNVLASVASAVLVVDCFVAMLGAEASSTKAAIIVQGWFTVLRVVVW